MLNMEKDSGISKVPFHVKKTYIITTQQKLK